MRSTAGIAFALALAAVACGPEARSSLTVAVRGDVTGIFPNPPMQTESHTFDVNSNVFEGLVRFDRNLTPEPALADRWENPDEETWIFHLRPGVRFSDGSVLTAQDVKASLSAAIERRYPTSVFLHAVESVRAIGTDRVEIRTKTPYPILLSKLHYGFVLPARALSRRPVPPIGTGPYALETWSPGHELVLTRNHYYRGLPSRYARIRFQVCSDAAERLARLRRGQSQIADGIPLSDFAAIRGDPALRLISGPGLRVLMLALRMDRPPFSDERIRRAVELAIDREELVRRVFDGTAVAATQLVTPSVFGYDPGISPPRPDPAAARRLLADAGYPHGLRVRLDGPNNRYVRDVEILREVARQLARAGIDVEVQALPKDRWFDLLNSGQSTFYLVGWACETRDAGDALDALVHSPRGSTLGTNNNQGLADPELDRRIDEANTRSTMTERNDRMGRAIARVSEIHAVIPLEIQPEAIALSAKLEWNPPINFGLRLFDR